MTEEKRAEITRLALAADDANQRVRALAQTNVPSEPEKRRALTVDYNLALAEAAEAARALTEARG